MAVVPTLLAVALLGWVLAYWTWAWFAPKPKPVETPWAQPSERTGAAAGLFGPAERGEPTSAVTGAPVKLLGIVAASGGKPGYAVLQLDGRQILAVRSGEPVAPGIRLEEVRRDHVVLTRQGVREKLVWPTHVPAAAPVTRTTK